MDQRVRVIAPELDAMRGAPEVDAPARVAIVDADLPAAHFVQRLGELAVIGRGDVEPYARAIPVPLAGHS